jgi:glutathione S-transferase
MYPFSSRERIDRFVKLCWYPVVDTYYDLLRATSAKQALRCELDFIQSLECLERELDTTTTEGDFFVLGDTFSLAECISAPWIQRFFVTLPYFRGIDFEGKTLRSLPRTANWMKAVCQRHSVVESKCPNDEMLDAARRYYVSFVTPGAPGRL